MKILSFSPGGEGVERDLFLSVPSIIYQNDKNYLGPSTVEALEHLNVEKNPLLKYVTAKYFVIVEDNDRPIGRVAAFLNSKVEDDIKLPRAMVGYFDCVDNYSVAKELLDQAHGWLAEQGCRKAWGPMNGSIWNKHRFKLSHFEEETFLTEPYNKSYYPKFFERYGFSLAEKWVSRQMDREYLDTYFEAQKERLDRHRDRVLKRGMRLEWSQRDDFAQDLDSLYELLMDSYQEFWGYYKIEQEEFRFLNKNMKYVLDKNEQILKIWKEDKLMAATIAHKHRMGDNDNCYKMLFHNAVAAEGRRGLSALGNILLYSCFEKMIDIRFPHVIYPVMHENNKAIMNLSAGDRAKVIGTYGIYCIDL